VRFKTLTGLLLGAVLVMSGCAATGAEAPTGAGTSATTASTFAFSGKTVDGTDYDGRELAGKPTVLWFWAPWCPTCRAQAGNIERIATDYAGEVNVVGVGGLADAADIRDFAGEVKGPTHLVDEEGKIWRHYGVTAQSTYVVLDADGAVLTEGYLDDDVLSAQVAELVD